MSEVKRYGFENGTFTELAGCTGGRGWVEDADYAALEQERDRLREGLDLACEWLDSLNATDEEGNPVGKGILESALGGEEKPKGEKHV